MKIKNLRLQNFGLFSDFEVDFPNEPHALVLVTGKNNAGKTTLFRAIKLINSALKFATGSSRPVEKELFRKDVQVINIRSMIHNFQTGQAIIEATFDNDKTIKVVLDSSDNSAFCQIPSRMVGATPRVFGFMPPLGQLAVNEELLSIQHILRYIDTSLAPHHLRNHLYHLLTPEQFALVAEIFKETWGGVVLHRCQVEMESALLTCIYNDGQIMNDIAWAGQGFQIWLQLVTHLVRLSDRPILLLDEPEIFLHPQKQHDLIQMLRVYYSGCPIIATHSSEIISDPDVSHIIYIPSDANRAQLRKTSDINALDRIRRQVGSTFNIHAPQFEDVDLLLATENQLDFTIISQLAANCGSTRKMQFIKLSGFTRWKDTIQYHQAYRIFFGREIPCSVLLDKDYYPDDYLDSIKQDIKSNKIKSAYSPGKEIENLFLEQDFLLSLLPASDTVSRSELTKALDAIYQREREPSKLRYVEFAKEFSPRFKGTTYTTVFATITPTFDSIWDNNSTRHLLVPGKLVLAEIREYFRSRHRIHLRTSYLVEQLAKKQRRFVTEFLSQVI